MTSLLHRLESICHVDVDDASTDVIRSIPFTPHNQTSNQVIITSELLKPENEALLKDLVAKHGAHGWEAVYNQAAVALCARNIPFLTGRVLVQVSLRYVNSVSAIIKQCHEYAAAFDAAGVSRDRFAIKIPFSGAGAAASKILNAEGIRTLATAVFAVEQAVAASQAGCVMISPYYNEIAAHLDEQYRLDFEDTALQHPMSPRVIQMLEFFAKEQAATGKPQPIMVIASHLQPKEVMAMSTLLCSHITISAANIAALLATPDLDPPFTGSKTPTDYTTYKTDPRFAALSTSDPLSGEWRPLVETDWVANDGEKLDALIKEDKVLSRRFKDAEMLFLNAEEKAKVAIESLL